MNIVFLNRLLPIMAICVGLAGHGFAKADAAIQLPPVLKDEKELSIKPVAGAAILGAMINSTGFTIIGVLYVAGVIAVNKENSKLFLEAQQENYKAKPLKDTFNLELQKEFTSRGMTLSVAPLPKKGDDGVISFEPAAIKTRWALWTEGIKAVYVADGSDAPYKPRTSVSVFLQDMQDKDGKLKTFSLTESLDDPKFSFEEFEDLQKDSKLAYQGLEIAITNLAQAIAGKLKPE